jgi:hypothetical protein
MARIAVIAAVAAAVAAPALAAPPAPSAAQRAAQLQALTDCRKITDPAQRLACYDTAAAALDEAEAKGDVVVVNREQARKVRKQAFGFSLPALTLFERGEKTEDVGSTDGTITEAKKLVDGHWRITLDEGGTWVQIDLTEIPIDPKPGQKVKIHRAAMGSYLMAVGNQREVKVRRVE